MTTRCFETSSGPQASLVSGSSELLTRSASNPGDLASGPTVWGVAANLFPASVRSCGDEFLSASALATHQATRFCHKKHKTERSLFSLRKAALASVSHQKSPVKPHYPPKATCLRMAICSLRVIHAWILAISPNKTPSLVATRKQTTTACGFFSLQCPASLP